ncbi:T9SS type A sorting domain-containing protein [Paradesertivirga mongoliensis]|uniref:T9SS type A sorting domain-containing protein n=1 Tax=Paradesertivirga mongoliensis TaxID=2100740 RepID=A0ABW4ZR22_9SPHI|nr:T9SS type A sorting domain-containing protein [Pedobacter mongoliensis]
MRLKFTKQLKVPLLAFVFLLMGVLHAQAQLVHPGILFSAAGLARIKKDANTERQPWAATYAKLLAYNDINYVQEPVYAIVERNYGGETSAASRAMSSQSQRAYRCAILWVITGDTTYAHISKTILNSWSGTLQSITGDAAKLCAAWYGFGFVNAAEILRYTNSGWSTTHIQRAEGMFRNKFYPVIEFFQPGHAGNWSTAITKTMMGIGVFINDSAIYTRGRNFLMAKPGDDTDYDTYSGTLYNYISGTTGQCYESGRDQEHTQMGIGGLAEACEIGYNQNTDLYGLYSNRLLLGTEYTAEYNLGYSVPYTTNHYGSVISPLFRGEFLPFYELVYNHYVNRLGMSGTPVKFTTMVVEKIRQDNGGESGDAILLGYGSFLFNEYAGFKYVPAAGDYRTTGLSSSMGTPSQFEVFTNGNWVPATTALGLTTNLLVRDGQSALAAGNRNLKNLMVGEGDGAVLRAQVNAGAVSALTIVEPGSLSSIPPLSFVNGGQATGSTSAVATITRVKVTGADINNQGSGYTSASVTFSGGGGSGATAIPELSGGKITGITITNSGSNYTSIPTMSVIGNGTGAAVSAKVGITQVSISSGGTGYTQAPTVIAGTFLKVSNGIALSVANDVFFQRGSSVYTAPASTGILNISGNLIAEDTVNCISVAHDNTMSSLTVNFNNGSDNIGFMGGNVTFNALGVAAANIIKLKLGAVMNIAGAITLNSTGIIDATNGTISFVSASPSTSTLRTVAANTFKNATLNKMVVNSTAGVTLNPVLTIGTLDMQKGLLNIPETSELNVSRVSGGSSTSYINTKSSATSGNIAKVNVTGLAALAADFPLGNGGNYLPIRVTPKVTDPATVSSYTMSVLTGLTANGLPNGGVVADKSQFVNASYHVVRTAGTADYTIRVGFPASLKGSGFTPSSPFGISKYNGSSWGTVAGSGDYALNTATVTLNTNGLRYRVQIGGAQPLNSANVENLEIQAKAAEEPTTLNEVKFNQNSIEVYPNPVKGSIVNVRLSEELSSNMNEVRFTLCDINGRKINIRKDVTGTGTYSILLPGALSDGVYQLIVEKNGAIASKPVLVQR